MVRHIKQDELQAASRQLLEASARNFVISFPLLWYPVDIFRSSKIREGEVWCPARALRRGRGAAMTAGGSLLPDSTPEKIYQDCRRQLILHGEAEPAGKAKGQERGPGAVCELS